MLLAPFFAALLSCPSTATAAPIAIDKDVRAQFVELAAKKDHDACLALWRAHPGEVLGTIDADLEGSLKVREKSSDPDMKKIGEMHARALWGAEISFEASGHPLILDYASAFVGWDDAQRKLFREGQGAFRRSMKALETKDAKAALTAGQECLDRAAPLGDWWGSAMGYDAIAAAQKALGANEKALESASFARTIYHDLGLEADEYSAANTMIEMCTALARPARGKVTCDRALALAKKLGDAEGEKRLTAQRATFEAALKTAK